MIKQGDTDLKLNLTNCEDLYAGSFLQWGKQYLWGFYCFKETGFQNLMIMK